MRICACVFSVFFQRNIEKCICIHLPTTMDDFTSFCLFLCSQMTGRQHRRRLRWAEEEQRSIHSIDGSRIMAEVRMDSGYLAEKALSPE